MAVRFNTTINWDAWYFDVLRWCQHYWIAISLTLLGLFTATLIFNAFISPYLTEHYKFFLRYESLLTDMKLALERDYQHLWEDPDFGSAFLKFYEDYQTFLSVARSDHAGKLRAVSDYNRFVRVRIGG